MSKGRGETENREKREMNKQDVKYDLEDRLIDFAAMVIDLVEALPNTRTGNYVANQLVRSGLSPAPNYGEAQSAESRKDFVHKMKIALKELKESRVWLRIIRRKSLIEPGPAMDTAFAECEELIRIFGKSISTAESRMARHE